MLATSLITPLELKFEGLFVFKGGNFMLFWIGLIVGIVIGMVAKVLVSRNAPVGTICVYENDDDGDEPYMFLVLERDIGYLLNRKRVTLKTELRQNPAQK